MGVTRRRSQRKSGTLYRLVLFMVAVAVFLWLLMAIRTFRYTNKNKESSIKRLDHVDDISSAELKSSKVLVECAISTPSHPDEHSANGVIRITVHNDLAPMASSVFLKLVKLQYYDGVFIFRVLKGFVAQWGLRNDHWNQFKPEKTIDNNNRLSNVRGTLSFAGGNPATKQVFVNISDKNVRLDKESRPFATLNEESMKVIDKLYTGYKDGQGQVKVLNQGDKAMQNQFPYMSRVEKCSAVSAFS